MISGDDKRKKKKKKKDKKDKKGKKLKDEAKFKPGACDILELVNCLLQKLTSSQSELPGARTGAQIVRTLLLEPVGWPRLRMRILQPHTPLTYLHRSAHTHTHAHL